MTISRKLGFPDLTIIHFSYCSLFLFSERLKTDELSAAKKEEESKLAREKMREEQRRRREAVSLKFTCPLRLY